MLTIICLCFQAERAFLDTFTLFRVLDIGGQKTKTYKHPANDEPFLILIPVLQEQEMILETIRTIHAAFGKTARIIVITTERETVMAEASGNTGPDTRELLLGALAGPMKQLRDVVEVIHYPHPDGRMAHQVNFALRRLKPRYENAHFILYNADSIPSPQTSRAFRRIFKAHPEAVAQQPCAFIRDAGREASPFVNALSLFQTLFCIGHETGLIRRYSPRLRQRADGAVKELLYSPLGWIVGHGSAMSISTCLSYGGYPEAYLNEDLTFGYILSARQVPIYSISALEIADVPLTWRSFIRQKTVWFWNFLEYVRCYTDPVLYGIPAGRKIALLLIGFGRGLYWFMSSAFFGLPFFLGMLLRDPRLLLLGVGGFTLFSFVPVYCLKKVLPRTLEVQGFREYATRVRSISIFSLTFALPIVVLSDSIGPWIATAQWIRWKISGALPDKPKTV